MTKIKLSQYCMQHHKAVALILSGDFNAKHTAWGNHRTDPYRRKLFENLDKTRYSINIKGTNISRQGCLNNWFQSYISNNCYQQHGRETGQLHDK